jgi:hypothetical protein
MSSLWQRSPNLCSVLILVLLAAAYITPFGDLDYAILIRTGELIVHTGDLRPPESFSYTIAGADIPDFEWLFEIVLWAVWTALGYGGLKLLKVLLVGAVYLVLGLRLRREGMRWHGIALALLAAVLLLAPGWNLRPLYFTSLGLLLVSGWLRDHCTGRRPLTWWLPLVMLVWANVHPGVITGQGLLAGAIAWEWLNRGLKLNPPLSVAACRRLTLVGGLGLAATFMAPHPIERLLCPFQPEVRHGIMQIFSEMQPLHRTILEPPYVTALVYVLAAGVGLIVVVRWRHFRLWEIGLLGGLAVLASSAVRSLQDWVLIMLALGVPQVGPLLGQLARTDRRGPWVRVLLRFDRACKCLFMSRPWRFQWAWPVAGLALLTMISIVPPLGRQMPIQERDVYPAGAVAWIETHGQPTAKAPWRIFGPPDYGAYLVWRLGDRVRCYSDTRGFCFPSRLIEDSHFIPLLGPDWRERLERVLASDTDYLLLETTGPRSELWQLLEPSVQPLYRDANAVLLSAAEVRRGLERHARSASNDQRAAQ